MHRLTAVPLLALFLFTTAGCDAPEEAPPPQTEILWDTWGVPHVYGATADDLFHAFGWAQMHSHGDLVLRLYGQARGRAAEYWGADGAENDRIVRTMGVPETAARWYAEQTPAMKGLLDAFVAGMNAYAEANPNRLDDAVEAILPVTPEDVMAHTMRVIHLTFVGGSAVPMAERWSGAEQMGSNGWAVAPARSASGNALLLANPHLPWSDFFTWYEVHLVGPGVDAYGASLVGMPVLGIAFNDHLGWTHTVNTFDGVDLYELELTGDGYRFDGEERAFEVTPDTLRIRQPDGTLRGEPLPRLRSVHGPVLARRGDRALAVRLVGLDQSGLFEQYWDMIRATDLDEFEAAQRRLQMPMFNTVYADRDGHILYLSGGRVPVRPEGGWAEWQGVMPGTESRTLWTETHPYDDLPRVVDPPAGWVQNANDPAWTSTFPPALDADAFPPYLSPRAMGFRPQRSARMLAEDSSITFDELRTYKHDTRLELADRLLDDLLPAARTHGTPLAKQAAEVLGAWDRRADAGSRGAVLFAAWAQRLGPGSFAEPWREDAPRTTPDGLADPAAAATALDDAARQVTDAYGALDVPWGEVYRLRFGVADLPANGGPGELGLFRVLWFAPDDDQRFRAVGGDSYVALVEFSDPVRAEVLTTYGNASQPGSAHRGDQIELFARQELRPVWRTRAEVEANLEGRTAFGPEDGAAYARQ